MYVWRLVMRFSINSTSKCMLIQKATFVELSNDILPIPGT